MERRTGFGLLAFVALFFSAVAFFFSRSLFLVTDLWWHLASGRWIAENLSLPQFDPFALLPAAELSLRQALVIKGFWLAQVSFYSVYSAAGLPGLVFYKSLLLTAIVIVTWKILVNRGVSPWIGLLLVSPLTVYLRAYDELRPQLFSFLFTALIILLMDNVVRSLKESGSVGRFNLVGVLVVMLFWANIHPGFVVGVGVVVAYSLVLLLLHLFGKLVLSKRSLVFLCSGSFCAAVFSAINPNNFTVYRLLLSEGAGGKFENTISEYDNVFKYFFENGSQHLFFGMIIIAVVAVIACASTKNITDICLLVVFGVAGFLSFRYAAFFVIMSTVAIGGYVAASNRFMKGNSNFYTKALVFAVSLLFVAFTGNATAFSAGATALGGMDDLVRFVKEKKLPGPVFSPYDWGGYIQWTMYPEYKVFVDQRCLNYDQYSEYRNVILGKKHDTFNKYKFKTVVYYLNPPTARQIPGIVFSLLADDEWDIVFENGSSLIFTKKEYRTGSRIDKSAYINSLEAALVSDANVDPTRVGPLLDLGQLYYVKRDFDGARRYFLTALKVDPDNNFARSWLDYLNSAKH